MQGGGAPMGEGEIEEERKKQQIPKYNEHKCTEFKIQNG